MKKSTERKTSLVVMAILGFNVMGVIAILILRARNHRDLLDNGSLFLETVPEEGSTLSDIRTCAHPNDLLVIALDSVDQGQSTLDSFRKFSHV